MILITVENLCRKIFLLLLILVAFSFCTTKSIAQGELSIISSMTEFSAKIGQSDNQWYQLSGYGFDPFQPISLDVSDPSGTFTISADNGLTYATTAETQADEFGDVDAPIEVRYIPPDAGPHSATISHSANGSTTKTLSVDGNPIVMPVTFLSFTAKEMKNFILLEWETATELNNSHFEVELMKDVETGFAKVGEVKSKVTNSKTLTSYTFSIPLSTGNLQYYLRLKQVDLDGAFSYSKIISASISGTKISISPNPSASTYTLNVTTSRGGTVRIVVVNSNGSEICKSSYAVTNGDNSFDLPLNSQPPGMYFFIAEHNGIYHQKKFIKIM